MIKQKESKRLFWINLNSMIKPPVKATDALEKPPAAKALPSRWIPPDDPKPRVNTSYKKVPRQFVPRRTKKYAKL